ncbi:MAG TPA: hypothetical protein VLH77_07315, partial [Gammaproteobacteria bacterium]|nr:hypothetical protein [Gammaproteobacteria bacterium]
MRINALIASFFVFILSLLPVFAVAQTAGDQKKINQISSETKELKKEMVLLRREVALLKNG